MTTMHVFLSHSSTDREVAERMVTALCGADADVWFDEHNLGATQLLDEITRQLRTRPVFIVLLSKAAFASDWVKLECKWAFNIHMRNPSHIILPVVVAPIDPNAFDDMLYLEDFNRIEQRDHTPYTYNEMVERTLRLLALTPADAALAPVVPQPAESLDDLLAQGRALVAQQRWVEALMFFQRATELDSADPTAWGMLGGTLNALKRHSEALTACDRSLVLNDQQAWDWYNKGHVLDRLGRDEEALAAYDQALAVDPNLAAAWYNKGLTLSVMLNHDEALTAYNHAVALDPTIADAWAFKGSIHREMGQDEVALASYDQVLDLDPGDAFAWRNKSGVLNSLGCVAEAEAAARQAEELGA